MGVSRSASVVLAYLMKEYNYSLEQAFNFTKQKRTCINPNDGFRVQLATYESILNAHRSKYNLFESVNNNNNNHLPAISSPNNETPTIPIPDADLNTEADTGPESQHSPDKCKN